MVLFSIFVQVSRREEGLFLCTSNQRFNAYGLAGEQISELQCIQPTVHTSWNAYILQEEYSVVELIQPNWDENGSEGQELGVRFDMQLAVIHDIVLAHDLSWDRCKQSIH